MRKVVWLEIVGVILLAAGLRFWNLFNYPAGLLADEAWWLSDALGLQKGALACCPLYFAWPHGGHPFFAYLVRGALALGLPALQAGRLTSASLGVLNVGMMMFVLRRLTGSVMPAALAEQAGILGGLALALNVGHITFSRLGLETLLAPLLGAALFGGLWLTLEKQQIKWAVLNGIGLGISLYTYAPALAFVAVWLAYGGWRWWRGAPQSRARLVGLVAVVLGVAALVAAPLAYTILFTPTKYFAHLQGTTHGTTSGGPVYFLWHLLENSGRTVWGISGAMYPNHENNLSGTPLFNPLFSLLFWIGVGKALLGSLRKSTVCQWALVWAVGASLPTLFSDYAPHMGRWLQALPAFVFFIGLGGAGLWQWLERSRVKSWLGRPALKYGALSLLCGLAVFLTVADYFRTPVEQWDQMESVARRRFVETALNRSQTAEVLVSPHGDPYVQPFFDLWLEHTPVHQVDGRQCLPLAWDATRPTVYGAATWYDTTTLERLRGLYPTGRLTDEFFEQSSPEPYAQFYTVPAGAVPALTFTPLAVEFAGGIEFMGYTVPAEIQAGAQLPVQLYWRLRQPVAEEVEVFVHLSSARDVPPAAQDDRVPCAQTPLAQWVVDMVYPDLHVVSVPADIQPGQYLLRVGVYVWPSLERRVIRRAEPDWLGQDVLDLQTIQIGAP